MKHKATEPPTLDSIEKKKCGRCKLSKPASTDKSLSEFYLNTLKGVKKFDSYCKSCKSMLAKESNARPKVRERERLRKLTPQYKKKRQERDRRNYEREKPRRSAYAKSLLGKLCKAKSDYRWQLSLPITDKRRAVIGVKLEAIAREIERIRHQQGFLPEEVDSP